MLFDDAAEGAEEAIVLMKCVKIKMLESQS